MRWSSGSRRGGGSPVVKALHVQRRDLRFNPCLRTKIPPTMQQKKKVPALRQRIGDMRGAQRRAPTLLWSQQVAELPVVSCSPQHLLTRACQCEHLSSEPPHREAQGGLMWPSPCRLSSPSILGKKAICSRRGLSHDGRGPRRSETQG